MKSILIIGDSFAADWSVKYSAYQGWPALLGHTYRITNLAQAGVSEYKIYKQLLSADLTKYDYVLVSHTSPYRVATRQHPVHTNNSLHKNADLIYSDIEYHSGRIRNWFNFALRSAYSFFLYHYDEGFQITTYKLYREKINQMLEGKPVIVISALPGLMPFATEQTVLDYTDLRELESGLINHFSEQGNWIIYQDLLKQLKDLK